MFLKKVSIFLLVFLFVACEGIVNEEPKLNNEKDQIAIDKTLEDITKENYSRSVSDLTSTYGERINTIGLQSGNVNQILNKVHEVWPTKYKADKYKALTNLRSNLKKYRTTASWLKAKGKSTSAFNILIQSEEGDTTFSKIEKRFLKDAQQVFDTKNKKAAYYVSRLDGLEKEYKNSYNLTDKDFITITGISESVGTLITTLNQSKHELVKLDKRNKVNKAGIFPPSLLFQLDGGGDGDGDAAEHYTGPGGGFRLDWGEVAGAGTLGAATGMLGATAYMGYSAAVGSAFGPAGTAAGAAGAYTWGALSGGGFGVMTELMRQFDAHKEYTNEKNQANE